MKRISALVVIAITLTLSASLSLGQQGGYDLFQKALVKERAVGDVGEAIRLYQRVLGEFGSNRALAAKAQFRLGLLYDRLGQNAEAQRAFNAVVSQYSDQTDLVRQAKARLIVVSTRTPNPVSEKRVPTTLNMRRIWNGPGTDRSGSPSPDGRYLSFTDWDTGDLAVRDLDSEKNRRLTNTGSWDDGGEYAGESVFSPDSKRIAYTWWTKDSYYELRTVGIDGSNPKVLYRDVKLEYLQAYEWSNDGKQITVYLSHRNQTGGIGLISAVDGRLQVLKTLDWWGIPGRVSVSPDSRYIAFDSRQKADAPERDILLMTTEDSKESFLIQHPANDELLGWTPDGRKVLFASDRTGVNCVWSIRVGNGKALAAPELIKNDIGRGASMGFSRDGTLYFGFAAGMRDVSIASLDPTTGKASAPPQAIVQRYVGSNRFPAWSPDRTSLAYVSTRGVAGRGGISVLCIRSLETGETREILPALSVFFRLQWAPDSRSLIVQGLDRKGVGGVYRIDRETGVVSRMMEMSDGLRWNLQPIWSPDGKHVYYVAGEPTRNDGIVMRNLETGSVTKLFQNEVRETRNLIYALTLSADGNRFAFLSISPDGKSYEIRIVRITGELIRMIKLNEKELPVSAAAMVWTPDGRELIFTTGPGNGSRKAELWRIAVDNGQPQKLGIPVEGQTDLHIHPDGKQIAFSGGFYKNEVWVLEHFLTAETNTAAKRRLAHRKR